MVTPMRLTADCVATAMHESCPDSRPKSLFGSHSLPPVQMSNPLLLLVLLAFTLSFPPTVLSQAAPAIQNFIFYQLPNRRPVAHSTLDQGELVLSRLRTRRSLQPLQTLGSFQPRVRPSREEEEERVGGPVYECTSLDGPECSFVRGVQADDMIIKLLQNLVAAQSSEDDSEEQEEALEPSLLSHQQDSGEPSAVADGSGSVTTLNAVNQRNGWPIAAAQHSADDRLTVSDEEIVAAPPAELTDEAALTAEEQAYFEELSTLSLSQLIMHRALERDGQAADELGNLDGDEIEYQLMTVGEDGVEREMTVEEKEELRQQLLNGEVDIEMEDEEPYWDEAGVEYNATNGEYEYGDDEELVSNGVH